MKEEDRHIIQDYLTDDEPFGPIDASEVEDPRALELLFEHHNKIYKALHQRPSIVVGRKGSGKTSYLHSVFFDKRYQHIAQLEAAEAFSNVINSISSVSTGVFFAESVAKLWENVLYVGLFGGIRERLDTKSKAAKYINDYLGKLGVRDGDTLDDILWKITDVIAERGKDKPHGLVAELLRKLDNVTFKKTKDELIYELKCKKLKAVVLLDSLDDFRLHIDTVSRAIQGLLKFVGEANKPSTPIDIRLCLPAELYHIFQSVSSNPNKDFRRKLVLHWVASELVMVASHRLNMYLWANSNPAYVNFQGRDEKKAARALLESIMPRTIYSKLDIAEDSLAYILRHTQLLPRHLLIIMNSIHEQARRQNGNGDINFSEQAIRKGVSAVEETIVQEIFVAFNPIYPLAEDVCNQCIPELHHKFSIGDLERVFRTHGKKAMGTDDFFDFKRMLVEIGAVGRVLDDSGRYIQAEFEYTTSHKLVTSTDDLLCFHPLFTEIFSAKIREKKPVYPYGSRIEDRDYRSID